MEKLSIILLSILPLSLSANDWYLSGRVSRLGLSADPGQSLSAHNGARFNSNMLNNQDPVTTGAVDHDVARELYSAGFLLDWYPGGRAFRFTVGSYFSNNEAGPGARSFSTTRNINVTPSDVNDAVSLRGGLAYPATAPYLGIGWGNVSSAKHGWGMAWDLGVLYQGDPDVSLNVNCSPALTAIQCATLTAEIESGSRTLKSDIATQKWNPVMSLGVLYRF